MLMKLNCYLAHADLALRASASTISFSIVMEFPESVGSASKTTFSHYNLKIQKLFLLNLEAWVLLSLILKAQSSFCPNPRLKICCWPIFTWTLLLLLQWLIWLLLLQWLIWLIILLQWRLIWLILLLRLIWVIWHLLLWLLIWLLV